MGWKRNKVQHLNNMKNIKVSSYIGKTKKITTKKHYLTIIPRQLKCMYKIYVPQT